MNKQEEKEEKEKELKLLHQALLLNENVVLTEVIERIIKHKSPLSYQPVADAFYNIQGSTKTYRDIFTKYFTQCYSEELLETILTKILSSNSIEHNIILLSIIWENTLEIYSQLEKLCHIAIKNSYNEAIEVYSIIDSLETSVSQENLLSSALLILDYTKANPTDEKNALLESIREKIVRLNNENIAN